MVRHAYIIGRDDIPPVFAVQGGSALDIVLVALPGVEADARLAVDISAPGAEVNIFGLYLCGGDDRLSIDVTVRHLSGSSHSRQLIKGIASGSAKVNFHGLIYVRQDSTQTKAMQENHNILLSDTATVNTLPQLEIYADDVECSHGATIGALSEDELFYLRSRGIPADEARAMQMLSFISPVLDQIGDTALRSNILDALSSL